MPTWDEILTDHGPAAYRAAWRVLGHAADTEDAVQDALLDGLKLHRTQAVANWGGLLRHLCVCRALDLLRRRRSAGPLPVDHPARTADPAALAEAGELESRFRRALATLAPREAEVFTLHHFADCDNARIAEQLCLSPEAVATALYKARQRLRAILQPEDDR